MAPKKPVQPEDPADVQIEAMIDAALDPANRDPNPDPSRDRLSDWYRRTWGGSTPGAAQAAPVDLSLPRALADALGVTVRRGTQCTTASLSRGQARELMSLIRAALGE